MSRFSRYQGAVPPTQRSRVAAWTLHYFLVGVVSLHGAGCGAPSSGEVTGRPLVLVETRLALPAELRQRIARESGISEQEVSSRVEGARLARRVAERGGLDLGRLAATRRAVLARAMLERLMAEERSRGPAGDDELDREVKRRWVLWDRPRGVVVMHALARTKQPADQAKAREVAEKLAKLLNDLSNPTEFEARVKSLPEQPVEVLVERLPPLTEDGRSFELSAPDRAGSEGPRMDAVFARAAHRITQVGANSPIVATPFGYHLIHLVEVIPPLRRPREEQRAELTESVMTERFRARLSQELERAKQLRRVSTERNADELTARLKVTE
jgi:hypothetical protein